MGFRDVRDFGPPPHGTVNTTSSFLDIFAQGKRADIFVAPARLGPLKSSSLFPLRTTQFPTNTPLDPGIGTYDDDY